MTMGIYTITCTKNGKCYVGSSENIEARWKEHLKRLRLGTHHNPYLKRCFNKYGSSSLVFTIAEVVDDADRLFEREQEWIDRNVGGLNCSPLAARPTNKGKKHSDEAKRKSSESNKRYWTSLSDEEKAARARAVTHPHTEETKQLLSERTRQAYADGKLSRIRDPHNEETKKKIKSARVRQSERQRVKREQKQSEFDAGRESREQARRQKLSKAHTGKIVAEATKAKLRAANQEQFADEEKRQRHAAAVKAAMTPEVKEKLRQVHLGKKQDPLVVTRRAAANRGKTRSPETIEKMREARRRYWQKKKQG